MGGAAEFGAGSACLAERRGIEMIDAGSVRTPYLRFGERIRMRARDRYTGDVPFGSIEQVVVGLTLAGKRRTQTVSRPGIVIGSG